MSAKGDWLVTDYDHHFMNRTHTKREGVSACGCEGERVTREAKGVYIVTSKTSGRMYFVGRIESLRAYGFNIEEILAD